MKFQLAVVGGVLRCIDSDEHHGDGFVEVVADIDIPEFTGIRIQVPFCTYQDGWCIGHQCWIPVDEFDAVEWHDSIDGIIYKYEHMYLLTERNDDFVTLLTMSDSLSTLLRWINRTEY